MDEPRSSADLLRSRSWPSPRPPVALSSFRARRARDGLPEGRYVGRSSTSCAASDAGNRRQQARTTGYTRRTVRSYVTVAEALGFSAGRARAPTRRSHSRSIAQRSRAQSEGPAEARCGKFRCRRTTFILQTDELGRNRSEPTPILSPPGTSWKEPPPSSRFPRAPWNNPEGPIRRHARSTTSRRERRHQSTCASRAGRDLRSRSSIRALPSTKLPRNCALMVTS